MNWEAIGAIGEIVGAIAVVFTIFILILQVRNSTREMQESNRLEKLVAVDRHADTVARWRARLAENEDLSKIWLRASRDEKLEDHELLRINFLWIEFMNTQRSNYVRALSVGETGLADQAVISLASHAELSRVFAMLWESGRRWTDLASPEFVKAVDAAIEKIKLEGNRGYEAVPLVARLQPDGTLK